MFLMIRLVMLGDDEGIDIKGSASHVVALLISFVQQITLDLDQSSLAIPGQYYYVG